MIHSFLRTLFPKPQRYSVRHSPTDSKLVSTTRSWSPRRESERATLPCQDALCHLSYAGTHHAAGIRLAHPCRLVEQHAEFWSGRWYSNPLQPACKAGTLPLNVRLPTANPIHTSTACRHICREQSTHRHVIQNPLFSVPASAVHNVPFASMNEFGGSKGSNLGSHKAADLQSAPFVHLGTCPLEEHVQT